MTVNPKNTAGKRVLLVCGGASSEHSISLLSAANVYQQLVANGHDVCVVGIPLDNTRNWRELSEIPTFTEADDEQHITVEHGKPFSIARLTSDFDVAFPILHGPYGEDGTIQGLFASIGLPYVGTSVATSALCMDKRLLKDLCAYHNIPQVAYQALHISDFQTVEQKQSFIADVYTKFTFPMFVKPTRMGSSIGVSRCQSEEELYNAIDVAFESGDYILIEQEVADFAEIECGVLGGSWGSTAGLDAGLGSVAGSAGMGNPSTAGNTGGAGVSGNSADANDNVDGQVGSATSNGGHASLTVDVPNLPPAMLEQISQTTVISPAGETVHASGWYDYEAKYFRPVTQNCPADVSEDVHAQCANIANTMWAVLEGRGLARFDFFVVNGKVLLNEINTMPGQTAQSLYPALMRSAGINFHDVIEILLNVALNQASRATATP